MESPFVEVHDTSLTDSGQFNVPVPNSGKHEVQLRAEQLTEMVQSLVGSLSAEDHQHVGESEANLLVQARLGMASSLFNALRCKHDETAAHCFRVAVTCSHWAEQMGLSEQERASLEIASLLHDIGKIGVADNVLLKPGELTPDEVLVMDRHWEAGLDILRASCSSEPVLEIVRHASSWYDGTRKVDDRQGEDIPLGARMLAIADAFDAMTSDQLYRRGASREQGLSELFRFAGKQFDPKLVQHFADLNDSQPFGRFFTAARTWLKSLDVKSHLAHWKFHEHPTAAPNKGLVLPFETTLLQEMHDAVIFIDHNLRVVHWNPGAERLTGIAPINIQQRPWVPTLLDLQDDKGCRMRADSCPITLAVRGGERQTAQAKLRGRNNRELAVKLDAMPVRSAEGASLGAAVLVQDISSEVSLAVQCQRLHEQAINDPLTQTANRAEFQRVHELFVAAHQQRHMPCSLIICDIDKFKEVNDTYGHPAGDEVIKSLARLLKSAANPGDLVARYGGEEFVMLCADCSNSAVAQRAEEMRQQFAETPQPAMNGVKVTASFGVTEIQPGDTPSTMLSRADRALYEAKRRGRNAVVQLGSGLSSEIREGDEGESNGPGDSDDLVSQTMQSFAPRSFIIEKLRGFSSDHNATVVKWDHEHIQLQVGSQLISMLRRKSDRQVPCILDIKLQEFSEGAAQVKHTKIEVAIRVRNGRDRRREEALKRARQLLASLKAYLMISSSAPVDQSSFDSDA